MPKAKLSRESPDLIAIHHFLVELDRWPICLIWSYESPHCMYDDDVMESAYPGINTGWFPSHDCYFLSLLMTTVESILHDGEWDWTKRECRTLYHLPWLDKRYTLKEALVKELERRKND